MMQDYTLFTALFGAFIPQIPLFLAYLAGGGLALVRWRKNPRASLYLLISVGLSLAVQIVVTSIQVWLPIMMRSGETSAVTLGYYYAGVNIVGNLFHTIAFCLLLAAIYANQDPAAEKQQNR